MIIIYNKNKHFVFASVSDRMINTTVQLLEQHIAQHFSLRKSYSNFSLTRLWISPCWMKVVRKLARLEWPELHTLVLLHKP